MAPQTLHEGKRSDQALASPQSTTLIGESRFVAKTSAGLNLALAERMKRQELALAHIVFGIGRGVDHLHDITLGNQSGVDRVSMFEVSGKV